MLSKHLPTHITLLITALLIPVTFLPKSPSWSTGKVAQRQMVHYYERIIGDHTDLEALAQIADYAARLSENDGARFMWLMNSLILDTPSTPSANWLAILTGPWSRARQRLHARWSWIPGSPAGGRFGSNGFYVDDGGNQVQHVWYSVAVAYCWGAPLADWAARYHEWNVPGFLRHLPGTGGGHGTTADLALSRQGIVLGRALAEGQLSPDQVADWLRAQLGPAS